MKGDLFGGIFGDMFDFNRNGKIDIGEQAAECMFLQNMMKESQENEDSSEEDDSDK